MRSEVSPLVGLLLLLALKVCISTEVLSEVSDRTPVCLKFKDLPEAFQKSKNQYNLEY